MAVIRQALQEEIAKGVKHDKRFSMERLRELVPAKQSVPGGTPAAKVAGAGTLCPNCLNPLHDFGTHPLSDGEGYCLHCLHWNPAPLRQSERRRSR